MTTGTAEKITAQMLKEPKLICAQKFLILGLNRDHPGFGDGVVLVDCQTGLGQLLSNKFRQRTRISKSERYCATCDEYRENGWAAETDEWDSEDDLHDDPERENSNDVGDEPTVIVPEYANFMVPGTELEVLYWCDDISQENTTERNLDSRSFYRIEVPLCLSFHINRKIAEIT